MHLKCSLATLVLALTVGVAPALADNNPPPTTAIGTHHVAYPAHRVTYRLHPA